MPNQERSFAADGKYYSVRFTQNALYMIEEKLGRRIDLTNIGPIELQTLLWGGLEGARIKNKSRRAAFTIEETGDIMDAMREEDLDPLAIVVEGINASFGKKPAAEENAAAPEGGISATSKNPSRG